MLGGMKKPIPAPEGCRTVSVKLKAAAGGGTFGFVLVPTSEVFSGNSTSLLGRGGLIVTLILCVSE